MTQRDSAARAKLVIRVDNARSSRRARNTRERVATPLRPSALPLHLQKVLLPRTEAEQFGFGRDPIQQRVQFQTQPSLVNVAIDVARIDTKLFRWQRRKAPFCGLDLRADDDGRYTLQFADPGLEARFTAETRHRLDRGSKHTLRQVRQIRVGPSKRKRVPSTVERFSLNIAVIALASPARHPASQSGVAASSVSDFVRGTNARITTYSAKRESFVESNQHAQEFGPIRIPRTAGPALEAKRNHPDPPPPGPDGKTLSRNRSFRRHCQVDRQKRSSRTALRDKTETRRITPDVATLRPASQQLGLDDVKSDRGPADSTNRGRASRIDSAKPIG